MTGHKRQLLKNARRDVRRTGSLLDRASLCFKFYLGIWLQHSKSLFSPDCRMTGVWISCPFNAQPQAAVLSLHSHQP